MREIGFKSPSRYLREARSPCKIKCSGLFVVNDIRNFVYYSIYIIFPSLRRLTSFFAKGTPSSYSFFTNRQRIAFSTARIITPTSAKIARYIFAIPTAPNARQANFTTSAIVIF